MVQHELSLRSVLPIGVLELGVSTSNLRNFFSHTFGDHTHPNLVKQRVNNFSLIQQCVCLFCFLVLLRSLLTCNSVPVEVQWWCPVGASSVSSGKASGSYAHYQCCIKGFAAHCFIGFFAPAHSPGERRRSVFEAQLYQHLAYIWLDGDGGGGGTLNNLFAWGAASSTHREKGTQRHSTVVAFCDALRTSRESYDAQRAKALTVFSEAGKLLSGWTRVGNDLECNQTG